MRFQVSYRTLFKWVRLYRQGGEERLLSTYQRPWNRTPQWLEEKIVLLKEEDPSLTVRQARQILNSHRVNISVKGIWAIWKRYGYAGFKKHAMGTVYTEHCTWTKEARKKFALAKGFLSNGEVEKSAEVLNSIPILPKNKLLQQVPDEYLNQKRLIEKTLSLFGQTSIQSYLTTLRHLYDACKKGDLNYSALRVGLCEVAALSWDVHPMYQLRKTEELKELLNRKDGYFSYLLFAPRIILLISEGIACVLLSQLKRATSIARICSQLLSKRKCVSSSFMMNLGVLYGHLEDFTKAEYWYSKSLRIAIPEKRKIVRDYLADVYYMRGEYNRALHMIKDLQLSEWGSRARILQFQATQLLVKGMPHRAISLSMEALSLLKKEEVHAGIVAAYSIIVSSYSSLGEKLKAESMLERFIPFLAKYKLERHMTILGILFSVETDHQDHILQDEDMFPSVKIALMLKYGLYHHAYRLAKKKGIMTYLHRYVLFFPDTVIKHMAKGKSVGLPRTMLRLPVFNKEIPVYRISFLGSLIVHKNNQYIKVKLLPKGIAFLIHFCLKAGEPRQSISLEDVYSNFWFNARNPEKNLSHLLVELRKRLKLPSHLLRVSAKKNFPCVMNEGVYFTTDYSEFSQTLTQAKAFERAGEWNFAKKEYVRAFKLFRSKPFKKMYDNWSEDIRRYILTNLEKEVIKFAKSCADHGDEDCAQSILKRISRIIANRVCSEHEVLKKY